VDLGLAGRVALVTGGSRGIGRAIAEVLRDEGASVAICGRDAEDLAAAARDLAATGARILPVRADIRDRDAVDRMVAEVVGSLGRLDVLVNNAGDPGGTAEGPLERISDGDLLIDFDTKFMGYLRCTRAVVPHLKARGWGRIVNVGGLSGREAGNYTGGIRNLALAHLTRTVALEVGPFGITVNLVHPGNVRASDALNALKARRLAIPVAEVEGRARQNAIRRPVEHREIAELVAFLASARASAITGETLGVSGGVGKAVVL